MDDEILDSLEGGLRRVMHSPVKHPANPVLTREHPWEFALPALYGTVLRDPESGLFKMWYSVWTGTPSREEPHYRICYATSPDGLRWERPSLGVAEFRGSRANNIVVPDCGMPSVLYTPWDPDPERRYKMFTLETLGRWPRPWLGLFSADGVHWRRHPEPLLSTGQPFMPGDEATALWDAANGRYVAFPKLGVGVGTRRYGRARRRSVALSISDDFLRWSLPEVVLYPDERDDEVTARRNARYHSRLTIDRADQYSAEFYDMYVYPYEGLYLGCLSVFDCSGESPHGNQDGTAHVQLASSRDLRHWNRLGDREPFVELGPEGSWEGEMILGVSSHLVEVGDELWLYYTGYPDSHQGDTMWPPEMVKGLPRAASSGIGLATLRRDGFVSVTADDRGGVLTTKPFTLDGTTLYVNADASRGELRCELVNGRGEPIEGFGRDDCAPFGGDAVRQSIGWRDGRTRPSGHDILRLRVHLRDARLYSFWFE